MFKAFLRSIIGNENILYWKGRFPSRIERALTKSRSVFYQQFIKPGDLCFDIGANYGNRVSSLLDAGGSVLAVEPQPACSHFLRKRFGTRIEVVEKGVGAQTGKLPLLISDAHTLSSFSASWIDSVKKSGRFNQYNWNQQIDVEMTTLDDLIGTYGKPKFIKIDVEGYELEVLSGLSESIEWICFEYTVPERTEEAIRCLDYLAGLYQGYMCNFIAAESTDWSCSKWQDIEQMKNMVRNSSFSEVGFGDIYVHGKR